MTLKRQGERLAGNIARDSDDLLRVAGRLGDHMNLGRVLDLHLKLFARRQRIAAVLRDALRPHVNDNRVRRRRPHADAFVRLRARVAATSGLLWASAPPWPTTNS